MELDQKKKSLLIVWVIANSVGWILGIIVIIMLGSLQDRIHLGNAVYIGIGMGWTVGLAQWLIARKWFGATSRWMWASTIGITAPFLFMDLIRLRELSLFVLPVLAAAGGSLAGWLQRGCLRAHSDKADWWVAASAAAWMCPALLVGFVAVPRHPETTLESVRNLSFVLGGLVLGAASGAALLLLHVRERPVSN